MLKFLILLVFTLNAYSSISNTPHNLSINNKYGDICKTCHIPTVSTNSIFKAKWNVKQDLNINFNMYSFSDKNSTIHSTSFVCLGCHDGVSAVNVKPKFKIKREFHLNVSNNEKKINKFIKKISYNSKTNNLNNKNIYNESNEHPIGVLYIEKKDFNDLNTSISSSMFSSQTIEDLLRNKRVECVSCHDPHIESKNKEVNFLRISNENNKLCKTCHNK